MNSLFRKYWYGGKNNSLNLAYESLRLVQDLGINLPCLTFYFLYQTSKCQERLNCIIQTQPVTCGNISKFYRPISAEQKSMGKHQGDIRRKGR